MTDKPLPKWLGATEDGVTLSVRVAPRSSRQESAGEENDRLKLKLKAPPVEGKANKELFDFIAKLLSVPKSSIRICSGEGSKLKRVSIRGVAAEYVLSKVF